MVLVCGATLMQEIHASSDAIPLGSSGKSTQYDCQGLKIPYVASRIIGSQNYEMLTGRIIFFFLSWHSYLLILSVRYLLTGLKSTGLKGVLQGFFF